MVDDCVLLWGSGGATRGHGLGLWASRFIFGAFLGGLNFWILASFLFEGSGFSDRYISPYCHLDYCCCRCSCCYCYCNYCYYHHHHHVHQHLTALPHLHLPRRTTPITRQLPPRPLPAPTVPRRRQSHLRLSLLAEPLLARALARRRTQRLHFRRRPVPERLRTRRPLAPRRGLLAGTSRNGPRWQSRASRAHATAAAVRAAGPRSVPEEAEAELTEAEGGCRGHDADR